MIDEHFFTHLHGKKDVAMAYWNVGDWAFAYFSEDGYWYPAEIIELDGKQIKVRYDDDDSEEWLEADSLAEYATEKGEEGAEAWFEEDEGYYAVTVLDANGEDVQVEYEDGTIEWTDLSYLRFAGDEEE